MPMDFPLLTGLSGDMDALVAQDVDGDRNHVLEIDRDWWIQPHWFVDGAIAGFLGGTWHIMINVESMGIGNEKTVARLDIPTTALGPGPITHPLEYRPWIRVPGLNSGGTCVDAEGVYKLVAVVTYTTPFGLVGRMAGFVEGPVLQFYHFQTPPPAP